MNRERRRRTWFIGALLILLVVVMIDRRSPTALDPVRGALGSVFSPTEGALRVVTKPVSNLWDSISSNDLRTEIEDLRVKNEQLNEELASLKESVAQSNALEHLNDALVVSDFEGPTARVVATSPSNFETSVIIDKGENDGLRIGNPVTSGAALVGRVERLGPRQATVRLVLDQDSTIGFRMGRSREAGVITGLGSESMLRGELIDPEAEVQLDEPLLTRDVESGLYPPNLLIGTVADVPPESGGAVVREFDVEPAFDLNTIEFVRVLDWVPSEETVFPPVGGEEPLIDGVLNR